MKRCPITYEKIADGESYSKNGLRKLSYQLTDLHALTLTAQEQRREAGRRSDKMSIQGVQPKLSAVLKIKERRFDIVDSNGKYILKPQCDFAQVPENEALTMSLAEVAGIEVPVHGLLRSKDESYTYFIRRFDRFARKDKLAVEDFAQLSGASRETKYDSSMEKVARVIERYCTFPAIQFVELFKRTIFCFLTGNEDMHLKNFSLITRDDRVELSPAYDFVNSTLAIPDAAEELALPLNGKKANLKKGDFIDYFAMERLGLNAQTIDGVLMSLSDAIPIWHDLIEASFLSEDMKERYSEIVNTRRRVIGM